MLGKLEKVSQSLFHWVRAMVSMVLRRRMYPMRGGMGFLDGLEGEGLRKSEGDNDLAARSCGWR